MKANRGSGNNLQHLIVVAVQALKESSNKKTKGFTFDELLAALKRKKVSPPTSLPDKEALKAELKGHDYINFDSESGKFTYAFAHALSGPEDILKALKDPPHYLLINHDVQDSYPEVTADIEDLARDHEIYMLTHLPSKFTIIYQCRFKVREGFPNQMSDKIRQLWAQVPAADNVDMNNYIKKAGFPLSHLDSNVLLPELRVKSKDKEAKKTKKRVVSKSKTDHLLLALASRISILDPSQSSNQTVKVEDHDIDFEDETKESVLSHNFQANDREYEILSELLPLIGHWFYEDQHIIVINAFIDQKWYREAELAKRLGLQTKQTQQALSRLESHKLIVKNFGESASQPGQAGRPFAVYHMDLDKFVNVVSYRTAKMIDHLQSQILDIKIQIFFCPQCETKFSQLDKGRLQDEITGQYRCRICQESLEQVDNQAEIAQLTTLLDEVKKWITPIQQMIKDLSDARIDQSRVNTPFQRFRDTSASKRGLSTRSVAQTAITVPKTKTRPTFPVEAVDLDLTYDFDPHPIMFCNSDFQTVFLTVVKDKAVFLKNAAARLAKDVLNEIAEFKIIISEKTYVYRITEHSLYIASTRGYTAAEIIRLMTLLGKNAMLPQLKAFTIKNTNDKTHGRATVRLKRVQGPDATPENPKWIFRRIISSPKKQVLVELIKRADVLSFIGSDQIEEVTSANGVTYNVAIQNKDVPDIKKLAEAAGIPLVDEYDFLSPGSTPTSIQICLRDTAIVRDYQRMAINRVFWNKSQAHSGVLVLPCGAGKTLIGIHILVTIRKPTIIFCQSGLALNQWKEQIEKFCHIDSNDICRFSAQNEWNPHTEGAQRKSASKEMMKLIRAREWGLMILDEVHLVPAKIFRQVTSQISVHIKLGLTATMIREDGEEEAIPNLVGETLFEVDIFTLRMSQFIAPVKCFEIHCPMTDIFQKAFQVASDQRLSQARVLLWSVNPNKTLVVARIINHHLAQNHKVMVFCDNLFALEWYTKMLQKYPKVDGSSSQNERMEVINKFKSTKGAHCVLFSQVGDQSIDLPEANVVIQLALVDGSRMQEGQRIGRIQRPQPNKTTAYFYSLVSANTSEALDFAKKRRTFLEDNGYTVKKCMDSEWKEYCSVPPSSRDTELRQQILNPDLQHSLIDNIYMELDAREAKRKADLANPGPKPRQGVKRKVDTTHAIQQIHKRKRM